MIVPTNVCTFVCIRETWYSIWETWDSIWETGKFGRYLEEFTGWNGCHYFDKISGCMESCLFDCTWGKLFPTLRRDSDGCRDKESWGRGRLGRFHPTDLGSKVTDEMECRPVVALSGGALLPKTMTATVINYDPFICEQYLVPSSIRKTEFWPCPMGRTFAVFPMFHSDGSFATILAAISLLFWYLSFDSTVERRLDFCHSLSSGRVPPEEETPGRVSCRPCLWRRFKMHYWSLEMSSYADHLSISATGQPRVSRID